MAQAKGASRGGGGRWKLCARHVEALRWSMEAIPRQSSSSKKKEGAALGASSWREGRAPAEGRVGPGKGQGGQVAGQRRRGASRGGAKTVVTSGGAVPAKWEVEDEVED